MGYTGFVGFKDSFVICIRTFLGSRKWDYINGVMCNALTSGENNASREGCEECSTPS